MAESKQYINQAQENGTVQISEDVLAAIVIQSVKEVEGVHGLNIKPGSDLADMIGKKSWGKGMKITIAEDNSVSVDCEIRICYGQSVVSVARAVQESIANHLESMTGVKVSSVNISVCGITRQ